MAATTMPITTMPTTTPASADRPAADLPAANLPAAPPAEEPTLAEALGLTSELAEAIAQVAEDELEAGRAEPARVILEGLVVSNPRDARAWTLLARVHRALRAPLAARFCAEVAGRLDGASPMTRLARAEGLLPYPEDHAQARELLASLASEPGREGERARALLQALGG